MVIRAVGTHHWVWGPRSGGCNLKREKETELECRHGREVQDVA